MKNDWQQIALEHWQKWRQEKPTWVQWGALAGAFLLYYLLLLLPLNYLVSNVQDDIRKDRTQVSWMAKASQEILSLRQALPHQREKSNESTFTLVNEAINTQGWNNLVNDVHQIEQNRVQVNFNPISFNELINWLETLFDKNGIFVMDATLQKTDPGIVQASLVLQQNPA